MRPSKYGIKTRASARSRSPSARSAVRSSPPTTSCRVRRHGLDSADQQVRRQRKRAAAGVPRHPLDLVSEGELRTNHTPRPTLTASCPDRAPGDAEEGGGNVRRAVTVIRPLRCELVAVRSSEASSEVNGRALSAGGGGRLLALLCFAAVPGSPMQLAETAVREAGVAGEATSLALVCRLRGYLWAGGHHCSRATGLGDRARPIPGARALGPRTRGRRDCGRHGSFRRCRGRCRKLLVRARRE
jgi:hypothetical protein